MLKTLLSLLPKEIQRGVALNFETSNIKPRLIRSVAKDLKRLKNIRQILVLAFITLFLLGYRLDIQIPPVKQNVTFAAEEQIQTIESDVLPEIQLPHPGYLSTKFSRFHPGVDIATGFGMPIHPISEGDVEEVNYGVFGYGNHVTVSHAKGLKSLYGHMGRIYVTKGQRVSLDDTLGTVGMSGFTSGPHTHLEISKDEKLIDPQGILPPLQNYPSEEYLRPYGGFTIPVGTEQKSLSKSLKPDFN